MLDKTFASHLINGPVHLESCAMAVPWPEAAQ